MDFFILFATAFGIAFGLMNGKAKFLTNQLVKVEFFRSMLVCAYCTGFHAGWLAWLLVRFPGYYAQVFSPERVFFALTEVLAVAFASAGLCYLLDTAAQWAEDTANAARVHAEKDGK